MPEPTLGEPWEQRIEHKLDPELVHQELQRIFDSRHFRTSKRCKQFLQYVVTQKLQGHAESLKERLIGAEVFGRDPAYSTGEDPVVRVQAGEVRRRLELYRAEDQIKGPLLIELPPGSYVPIFRLREMLSEHGEGADLQASCTEAGQTDAQRPKILPDVSAASKEELLAEIVPGSIVASDPVSQLPSHRDLAIGLRPSQKALSAARWQGMAWGVAICLCLVAVIAFGFHLRADRINRSELLLKQFWGPAALSPKPILLCLPNPILYRPSSALFEHYAKSHPGSFQTLSERENFVLPLVPRDAIRWGDMNPITDSGPTVGGVVGALNLSKMFAQQDKPFEVRFGAEASYAELRGSPAVIIGALNAQWIMQITSELPFIFEEVNGQLFIHERNGPERTWKVEFGPHGKEIRDYGLITRQVSSGTGQFLVQVAGMTGRGTEAASEVVSNPSELAAALAAVPDGWQDKNIQMVISAAVGDRTSGPPHVVAFRVW